MQPPMQVAAPPNGSISVGWLCVSFLNRNSQSSSSPLTSTFTLTVQALISSDSSRPVRMPFFLSHFAPIVPISIRHTGLGVAAELVTHLQIAFESGLDRGVVDVDLVQFGAERGVAAVVGPVGIDHLDLGDRGLASLFGEVLLAELKIGQIHGEPALVDELLAGSGVHLVETGDGLDLAGHRHLGLQGFLGLQAGLAGLDRVDHVMLDGVHVGVGQVAFQRVQLGGADGRALAWEMSWMHSAAESARWSNWPGRNSVANTVASPKSGRSAEASSTCGSLNTVGVACSKSSWEMPSTS